MRPVVQSISRSEADGCPAGGRWVLRGREMWEVAVGGGPGQELRTFCLPSSSPDGSADGLGLTVALLSGGPNDPTRTGHALASPASAHGMTALLPTARVCLLTLHGLREPHTGKNFQVPDVNIGGQEWGLPQDAGGSWGRSVWAGQETTSSH